MKYLRTFDTKTDYKTAKKGHSLNAPNVSYIKEDGSTYIMPAFVNKYNAEAGDILAYTKESYDKWTNAADGDAKTAAFNKMYASIKYIKPEAYTGQIAETYIADGIVAVPYSHTDDNTVRVMSLKYMDTANPELGSEAVKDVAWGAYVDISGIQNHTGGVCLRDPDLGDISGLASTNPVYLPSDVFTAKEVIGSDSEYYWNSANGSHVPCPYLTDGSLNPQFRGVDSNGSTLQNNCLSDMNGMPNTKAIIDTLDKNHLDKTLMASTIANTQSIVVETNTTYSPQTVRVEPGSTYTDVSGNTATAPAEADGLNADGQNPAGDKPSDGKVAVTSGVSETTNVSTNTFPAAICCQRYHSVLKPHSVSCSTSGSSTTITYGDWYLPSAGEAAYIIVSQGKIAYALGRINAAHPNSAAAYGLSWLWSSSEYGSHDAWFLSPSDGLVHGYNYGKTYGYRVRAFAAF